MFRSNQQVQSSYYVIVIPWLPVASYPGTPSFFTLHAYGIPKQTKLDDTQINCQTILLIKQLSNLSKRIVKHIQNNCQTAIHKNIMRTRLKELSIFVQSYRQYTYLLWPLHVSKFHGQSCVKTVVKSDTKSMVKVV